MTAYGLQRLANPDAPTAVGTMSKTQSATPISISLERTNTKARQEWLSMISNASRGCMKAHYDATALVVASASR